MYRLVLTLSLTHTHKHRIDEDEALAQAIAASLNDTTKVCSKNELVMNLLP